MAAHRYWRLLLGRRSGVAALVTEVQFRTSIGGATATTGGTALGSTGGTGAFANAFDGSTATTFLTAVSDPAYIGYDFGSAVLILEAVVSIGATAATTPYYFMVQWSDDNTNWFSTGTYDISYYAVSSDITVNGWPASPLGRFAPGVPIRLGTAWPTAALHGRVAASPSPLRVDPANGGPYQIFGTVAVAGAPNTPVRRQVRLFTQAGGLCVRSTWSDPVTGAYSFIGLSYQYYFEISDDYTLVNQAAARDFVLPTPM